MGSLHSPSSASEMIDSSESLAPALDLRQKNIDDCTDIVRGMLDKCLGVQIEGLGSCRTVEDFTKLMSHLPDNDIRRIKGMLTGQREPV